MATAGSIVVDLLMRTGSFETDSKRAEKRLKDMGREIDKTARQFRNILGVVAGTTGLVAALKSATNYMAEMGMAAQRTSVSTQVFTELAYAADQAALSQGELERVLRRSTEAINHGIKGGSRQAEALEKLGISAYDAAGKVKTADQMLKDMAERFSQLEPSAQKTGLVIDLFGTQLGQKVIPLLNQGAEGLDEMADRARRLGLVIDDEAAQAAIDFGDNLADLKRASQGLAITLSTDLVPSLNTVIGKFDEATKAGGGFMGVLATFASALPGGGGIDDLIAEQQRLEQKIIDDRETAAKGGLFGWIGQQGLNFALARLAVVNREIEKMLGITGDAPSPLSPIEVLGAKSDSSKKTGARTRAEIDEGQRLIAQMNERIALLGKETEYEQLLARIGVGSIKFRTQADKDHALALAKTLDMRSSEIEMERTLKDLREQQSLTQQQFMRDLAAFGQSDSVKALNDDLQRVEDRYRSIIDARRNSPLGLSDAELEQIRVSLDAELEMVRWYHEQKLLLQQDWKLGAVKAIRSYTEEADNLFHSVGSVVNDAFKGMEESLAQFVVTGKMDFKSLADSIIHDMARIAIQQSITGPLAGMMGKLFSSGPSMPSTNSWVGVDEKWSDGGFTGFGGKYDPAGIVHRGEYVMTKEATSRIGVPALDRLNRGYTAGGLGGRTPGVPALAGQPPNVEINVINQSSQPVQAKQGPIRFDGKRLIQDVILSDTRVNGPITRAMKGALA